MGSQMAFLQTMHRVLNVRKLSYIFTFYLCPLPFNFSRNVTEIFVRATTLSLCLALLHDILFHIYVGSL